MNKFILLVSVFLIIFFGCKKNNSKSNIENKKYFHQNTKIDNIIKNYNNISENKINEKDLTNVNSSQEIFEIDNIRIKITDNEPLKKIFIVLEGESLNVNNIKNHGAIFMKALDNKTLTDDDIKEIFRNLESYNYYDNRYYMFIKFEFKLSKKKLSNTKNIRYKFEISYQYN